jgi:hypothetical protein
MNSVTLGWALVILGFLSYVPALVVGLITAIKAMRAPADRALITGNDLKAVAEVLDKLAKVLDSFGKLSVPLQWALLGMANIGIGAYLIANKPF